MSRQGSRIQRWLRGDTDLDLLTDTLEESQEDALGAPEEPEAPSESAEAETAASTSPAPAARTSSEGPAPLAPIAPLPRRAPDEARARVQGLGYATAEIRRRQVTPNDATAASPVPKGASTVAPAPAADELIALEPRFQTQLAALERNLDGFVHAVLSTRGGAALSYRGLEAKGAESLARATGGIAGGLGVPEDVVDVMALTLTTGDTVVCVGTGTPEHPAILRVTLGATSLGIALHQVQQAGREITNIVTESV